MNGTIILSGGGSAEDSKRADIYFLKKIKKNPKILYIPHANIKQKDDFSSSICWITDTFRNIDKKNNFEIFVPKNLNEVGDIIGKYDAVYIGGGNTFYLMQQLQNSGLDIKLADFFDNGGVIYGGSAGAIVLGLNIDTVPEEMIEDYENVKGIGLLGDFSIVCHFDQEKMDTLRLKNDQTVICLYERSSIIYDGKYMLNFGSKPFEIKNKINNY